MSEKLKMMFLGGSIGSNYTNRKCILLSFLDKYT